MSAFQATALVPVRHRLLKVQQVHPQACQTILVKATLLVQAQVAMLLAHDALAPETSVKLFLAKPLSGATILTVNPPTGQRGFHRELWTPLADIQGPPDGGSGRGGRNWRSLMVSRTGSSATLLAQDLDCSFETGSAQLLPVA